MMKAAWPVMQPNVLVLDTREAILDLAPLVQEMADRCGHAGAAYWLKYLTEHEETSRRIPYLVLILRPEEHQGRSLCADDVAAAALFFEYRIFGLRSGAVATADAMGFSSVIAPAEQVTRMAAIAAFALLQRGADIVLASYESEEDAEATAIFAGAPDLLCAARQRSVSPTAAADAFVEGSRTVADLVVCRTGLRAAALRWASGFFASPHSVLGRTNFLSSVLQDRGLRWSVGLEPERKVRPALGKGAPSQGTA